MTVRELFESMEYGPAPEDPAPALAWLDRHRRAFAHFIGGHFVESADGASFETVNPADGTPLARVAQGESGMSTERSGRPGGRSPIGLP